MKIVSRNAGSVYSGSDYDAYSGRVVDQYTTTTPLRDGSMLVSHKTVIDLGRPSAVVVADVDAQLKKERLPARISDQPSNTDWVNARRTTRMKQLVEWVTEHGPMPVLQAADMLGCHARTIRDLVDVREGVQIIGKTAAKGQWIGLPGQVIPAKPLSFRAQQVRTFLAEHGPADASTIARMTGVRRTTISAILRGNVDTFIEVERRKLPRGGELVVYKLAVDS